jgi:hypothetical protein
MTVVIAIVVAAATAVTLAGTLVIFPAMWQGFRDQWRRIPPENRPRAIGGGVLTAILILVGSALGVAQPWGPDSVAYVILVGGGGLMVLILISVAVQGIQASPRERERRTPRGE